MRYDGKQQHRSEQVQVLVMEKNRIKILGIPIDDITEQEALERADAMINDGAWHQICTVNPEFIMEARRNPSFRAVLQAADLNTPDGFGVLLAARWLGTPLRGRVTGVELTLGSGATGGDAWVSHLSAGRGAGRSRGRRRRFGETLADIVYRRLLLWLTCTRAR
jgi:hypothetical protein